MQQGEDVGGLGGKTIIQADAFCAAEPGRQAGKWESRHVMADTRSEFFNRTIWFGIVSCTLFALALYCAVPSVYSDEPNPNLFPKAFFAMGFFGVSRLVAVLAKLSTIPVALFESALFFVFVLVVLERVRLGL